MQVLPGNASHIGLRRQQQDAYALSDFDDSEFVDHGGYLAVVADGIGGMLHGGDAAKMAVAAFMNSYLSKYMLREVDETLDTALLAANSAVFVEAEQRGCPEQMGTTLIAAVIHDGHLHWRSVGDSHLYLCRDGRLSQLNADHNFAVTLQAWVSEGLISQNMADHHPERGTLGSFVGLLELQHIDRNRQPLPLQANDRLLLCSDGIYGGLSDEEIIACLGEAPMIAAQRLCVEVLAKQKPTQDNLTAVVLAYKPLDKNQPTSRFRLPVLVTLFCSVVLAATYLLLK